MAFDDDDGELPDDYEAVRIVIHGTKGGGFEGKVRLHPHLEHCIPCRQGAMATIMTILGLTHHELLAGSDEAAIEVEMPQRSHRLN
jgi:hypothetical protein